MSVQPAKPASHIRFLCKELPKVYVFSANKMFTTFCAFFLIEYLISRSWLCLRSGVGKLRLAGHMRPSRACCAAREHFLKLRHIKMNMARGITGRKSDVVSKKGHCPFLRRKMRQSLQLLPLSHFPSKEKAMTFFRHTIAFVPCNTSFLEDIAIF